MRGFVVEMGASQGVAGRGLWCGQVRCNLEGDDLY